MRGDDSTSKQMLIAPQRAIFIWVNSDLYYPRELAKKLKRDDLTIVSPSWLDHGFYGKELSGVVADHAAWLDDRQYNQLLLAKTRIISPANTREVNDR